MLILRILTSKYVKTFLVHANEMVASSSSSLSSSGSVSKVVKSTRCRIVGRPCGQFQGDSRSAKCSTI